MSEPPAKALATAAASSFNGADVDLAIGWLNEAARIAGLEGVSKEFSERVFRRLEKGAREYGSDNYLRSAIDDLMGEGSEEGDDIAGWALVIAMRIYVEAEALNGQAELIQERLLNAASHGLRAWWDLRQARELLEVAMEPTAGRGVTTEH